MMLAQIGIPIYKECLTANEKISLKQLDKVMHSWKKVFIAPDSLRVNMNVPYEIIRFPDAFFKSKKTYSQLLMDEKFYERFSQYKFLLVYQLDAFVFSDRLKEFCALDMDYIGAPAKGDPYFGDNWLFYHVGNGGLSLRKISSCLRVVKKKADILQRMLEKYRLRNWGEDDFFAFCGKEKDIDFVVPNARIATEFSVQNDYVQGLRKIKKVGLPFGCHYWTTENYFFWKPYIESYGYKLPDDNENTFDSLRMDCIKRHMYLAKRYIRTMYHLGNLQPLYNILNPKHDYCVWGMGYYGKKCIAFFESIPVRYNISKIYDRNAQEKMFHGIEMCEPNPEIILREKCKILISTVEYEGEIKKRLSDLGLKYGIDTFSFFSVCEALGNEYLILLKNSICKNS